MADNGADETKVDQTGAGGIEGPEATYVKLVASDGHEFIVRRDHALTSGTIKAMLSGPGEENDYCSVGVGTFVYVSCFTGQFAENETNEVRFREIP